jgi:radical SAM protein with 4Fe4S-binding SPASM domain
MNAINLTNKNPGGKREKLINKLPLDTPYVIQWFVNFSCNFRCIFCSFEEMKKNNYFNYKSNIMDFDLYKKCVDDATKFNDPIRTWRIVGIGEPTLWKHLSEAIKYTKKKKVAKTIELITNGSLLKKELANKLIDAGLDRLVISVQGLSSEDYKKISKVNLNFQEFINNIRYFYENRKQCHVYIKIADIMLKNQQDKDWFYTIFGDICDSIAIEKIVNLHSTKFNDSISSKNVTQFGGDIKENINICPLPFYFIEVRINGDVMICYNFEEAYVVGNIKDESIVNIWNGKRFNEVRYDMIKNTKNINKVCKRCTMISHRYHIEDDLDNYREKLLRIYE